MHSRSETLIKDDFSLQVGVLASIIIHAFFLWLLFGMKSIEIPKPMVIDVSIEPPKKKMQEPIERKNQMVSPSEKTVDVSPSPDTNRYSDTDSSVIKEQVKRGANDAGPVIGKKEKPVAKEQASTEKAEPQQRTTQQKKPQENQKKVEEKQKVDPNLVTETKQPKLSDLKLDSKTLMNEFALNSPKGSKASPRPFSRPAGSGAMFIGMSGSSDYLPDLPDGDITLLNAKANQFAVFVRRVAIQVFSQIRTMGWQNLSKGDIQGISQDTMVEAVMSPKGELLKVTLEIPSGSGAFDELILKSAKKGAKDPNPPEGAKAADGNVHFIFKSRSWSDLSAGRGGYTTERRWLLLETGLE